MKEISEGVQHTVITLIGFAILSAVFKENMTPMWLLGAAATFIVIDLLRSK